MTKHALFKIARILPVAFMLCAGVLVHVAFQAVAQNTPSDKAALSAYTSGLNLLLRDNKPQEAIPFLSKAIAFSESSTEVTDGAVHGRKLRGIAYMMIEDWSHAKGDMSKYIQYEPNDPAGHYDLGVILSMAPNMTIPSSEFNRMLNEFKLAVKLKPDFPDAHAMLATCYGQAVENKLAAEEKAKAPHVQPRSVIYKVE